MNNFFSLDKGLKVCNSILRVLLESQWNSKDPSEQLSVAQIAAKSKVAELDIKYYYYLLKAEKEIAVSEPDGLLLMRLEDAGRAAYLNKKYIRVAEKLWWERFSNLLSIAAVVISILALISTGGGDTKNLQSQIDALKIQASQQIIIYRDSVRFVQDSINHPNKADD